MSERGHPGAGSRRPAGAYDQPAPGGFLAEMIAGSRRRVAAARVGGRLRRPEQVGEPGRLREALARPTWTPGAPSPQLAVIAEVKRRSPSKGDIAPGSTPSPRRAPTRRPAPTRSRCSPSPPGSAARSTTCAPWPPRSTCRCCARTSSSTAGRSGRRPRRGPPPCSSSSPSSATTACTTCSSRRLDCGLDPLVEVHDLEETRRACRAGCTLVGINNRDLVTLEVDLETTEYLAPALGPCMFPVSESGISTPADACRAALAGARALLVGETLVRTPPEDLPALIGSLKDPGWPA